MKVASRESNNESKEVQQWEQQQTKNATLK